MQMSEGLWRVAVTAIIHRTKSYYWKQGWFLVYFYFFSLHNHHHSENDLVLRLEEKRNGNLPYRRIKGEVMIPRAHRAHFIYQVPDGSRTHKQRKVQAAFLLTASEATKRFWGHCGKSQQ